MPSLAKIIEKIEAFARLEKGWRFGKGVPVELKKIETAKHLLEYGYANGIVRFNAFAGDDGALMISFYHLESNIDITLEMDGTITYATDEADEQIEFIPKLNFVYAYEKICEFAQNIQEPYTQTITTLKKEDSKAFHSNPTMTEVFPYSTVAAGLKQAGHFAVILLGFTMLEQATLQYTGKSQATTFRRIVDLSQPKAPLAISATTTLKDGKKNSRANT